VTDTLGIVLRVRVHRANVADSRGAKRVLATLKPSFERLKYVWADRAYRGTLVEWAQRELLLTLHIVAKPDGAPAYVPLPRRWVIERTFAWLGRYRRLVKDYERRPSVSAAFIYIASIRRLACLCA